MKPHETPTMQQDVQNESDLRFLSNVLLQDVQIGSQHTKLVASVAPVGLDFVVGRHAGSPKLRIPEWFFPIPVQKRQYLRTCQPIEFFNQLTALSGPAHMPVKIFNPVHCHARETTSQRLNVGGTSDQTKLWKIRILNPRA